MWNEIATNYTLRIVLIGIGLLGAVSGIVGVFLTLRKQALIGDALSHAALPGIVLAYMLTERSTLYVSILGAIAASALSILFIELIKRYSIIKNDALLAVILSSMFGLGQVFLSVIRDTAGQDQARLNTFIFGQAATMSQEDVLFIALILGLVFLTVISFWRHMKAYVFDHDFYLSLGYPGIVINVIINALAILVIVSGIQSVGVILMSALLIAPSVSARLWSNRLGSNVILSALIGALSGVFGTLYGIDTSTGPVIVIFASGFVVFSILCAPGKGILWMKISSLIHVHQVKKYHALIHLFETNELVDHPDHMTQKLLEEGYMVRMNGTYELTPKGQKKVSSIMVGELK
ncbi:MAG: metal ABC transporter permease [Acholeplasmataceae bacterium]